MNTRSRSRFTRYDLPFFVLGVFLLVLLLSSLTSHAAESSALDQVASEVAAKVAGDIAGNSIMSLASDAGMLGLFWWYFRRLYEDKREQDARFLADKKATDAEMIKLMTRYATLSERVANALDNISAGKPTTGRFPRDPDQTTD